jgi:hypothetical protein
MRPFCAREVTRYLLWVIIALLLTAILGWRLFLASGRKTIHPQRGTGSTAQLSLPGSPRSSLPDLES